MPNVLIVNFLKAHQHIIDVVVFSTTLHAGYYAKACYGRPNPRLAMTILWFLLSFRWWKRNQLATIFLRFWSIIHKGFAFTFSVTSEISWRILTRWNCQFPCCMPQLAHKLSTTCPMAIHELLAECTLADPDMHPAAETILQRLLYQGGFQQHQHYHKKHIGNDLRT